MWQIKYTRPNPRGVKTTYPYIGVSTSGKNCWYDDAYDKWISKPEPGCSSCCIVKSKIDFNTHLNNHHELKGQEVSLVSRYGIMNLTAIWIE